MARILHVSAVDFTTSKLLVPQLDYLRDLGYDVRVATGRTDDVHWSTLERFRPIDLAFPRSLNPLRMLSATSRLRSVVADWQPDLLHLHTPAASLPVRLMPRWLWPREMRIAYTVHGYLHMWPPVGSRDRLVQRIEQWEAGRTDASLFQSLEDFEHATDRGYRGRLVYLGNGVQDEWFDLAPLQSSSTGPLELLFVGRLVREKGILDLLEAVALVPGVRLHVAGDALPSDRDGVREEVRDMIERLGISDRVELHGMLSRTDLMVLYARIHVLCLPSHREGVPRSVIEALAAARPVIATDIRGSRELVIDGLNGFLTPAGDHQMLAGSLQQVCGLSHDELTSMAESAKSSVDPKYRESRVFERLGDTYLNLGLSPVDM